MGEPHWTPQRCVVHVGSDVSIRLERDYGDDWRVTSWKHQNWRTSSRTWTGSEVQKLIAYMSLEGLLRPGETVRVE